MKIHKRINAFLQKNNLLLLGLSFALSLFGAYCFFGMKVWILFLALGFALFLRPSFSDLLAKSKERQARRALMNFLQYLCSALSVGQPVRLALSEMGKSNFLKRSTNKDLQNNLKRVSHMIHNQQSAEAYLPTLEAAFPCPESTALLYALRLENQLGEKLIDMLRDSFDTARELVMLEDEIAAANNRQRSESMILSVLPFAMAPLFADLINLDLASSGSAGLGAVLRFFAYGLAMFAFMLNLRFSAERSSISKNIDQTPKLFRIYDDAEILHINWLSVLINKLPLRYRTQIVRLYRLAYPQNFFSLQKDTAEPLLFQHVLTLILVFSASFMLLLLISLISGIAVYWSLLLSLLTVLLFEGQLRSRAKENEESLRRDLPLMLSLLARLLRNTLHLSTALRECASIFSNQKSPLSTIVKSMMGRINYAESPSQLFEELADQLKLSDVSSLLYVLARYSTVGSKELLDILEKQLGLCWAEQRQNIRRNLDAKSGLSLIPMLMDLVAVMLIGIAPAMQVFMAF